MYSNNVVNIPHQISRKYFMKVIKEIKKMQNQMTNTIIVELSNKLM